MFAGDVDRAATVGAAFCKIVCHIAKSGCMHAELLPLVSLLEYINYNT